jgi:Cu2+-exporting ATPase
LELGAVSVSFRSFLLLDVFFVRAWKSVITWNLNMFTLIGIGSGVLFSLFGLFFPELFPNNSESGTVHLF